MFKYICILDSCDIFFDNFSKLCDKRLKKSLITTLDLKFTINKIF